QIKVLREESDKLENWYATRAREGKALWLFTDAQPAGNSLNWSSWQDRVKDLLESAKSPPARSNDVVPGTGSITFATLFAMENVPSARKVWEGVERDLVRIRDLSAALGLGGSVMGKPAVLAIPATPGFSLVDAGPRLDALRKNYPRYAEEFTLTGM